MRTIDRLNDDWLLATEIQKIEARVWRKTQRDHLRLVVVTSAARGDGKSTTVAYLATALGLHQDRRILAVDLDFREPQLNSHFQLEVTRGLGGVLRGEYPLDDAILRTSLPGLHLVLPTADGEDPSLLLRTTEFAGIFDYFRRNYDLVLLDVPALNPVADATAVLPLVDAVILMAMAGKTTRPQLTRAREICVGLDANIIGLIVGNLQEAVPEYGDGGYHYGYGGSYGRGRVTSDGGGDRIVRE
jgi:protein-tyrosine kinase